MSVTVSEISPDDSNMRGQNIEGRRGGERNAEHKEGLLDDKRPQTSDKLRHAAKGLEAIGFNEHASMYHHGYRHYSVDSQERDSKTPKERKRAVSFIKKLIGGGKEKGEKI